MAIERLVMKLGSVAFTAGAAGVCETTAVYEAVKGNYDSAVMAACVGVYLILQCYLNARSINMENTPKD